MERVFGRVFFALLFRRHPDCKLGRAGEAAPVWDVKPILCRPACICGIGLQRLFSVFAKEAHENLWHDGAVFVYEVWCFGTARRHWLVCFFAWLPVCQCACMHEIPGNAACPAVHFSADPALCGCIFWDWQDLVRDKDRGCDANGYPEAAVPSKLVFAAVRISLYGCRSMDGGLCKSAFINELYTQNVRGNAKRDANGNNTG